MAFHRFHEETSQRVFNKYRKRLLNSKCVRYLRDVIKCARNNAKLTYDDAVLLETIAVERENLLRKTIGNDVIDCREGDTECS